MMKQVAILFAIFCMAYSQRPPYAGSADRSRYPQVLPQYMEEQQAMSSLQNRINTDNRASSLTVETTTTTTARTVPLDLPVDALGDIDLINRIKTWPREKQPFWYLNWIQIQEHRGDTRFQNQRNQATAQRAFNGY